MAHGIIWWIVVGLIAGWGAGRIMKGGGYCDTRFGSCKDEEQFFLGKGFGQWQWRHYRNDELANTTLINHIGTGTAKGTLPCPGSYQ